MKLTPEQLKMEQILNEAFATVFGERW